jgi:hypothetical protein
LTANIIPGDEEGEGVTEVEFEISSDVLVKNVYLSIYDVDKTGPLVHFTGNYFDLLPGETRAIGFRSDRPVRNFKRNLEIVSLKDAQMLMNKLAAKNAKGREVLLAWPVFSFFLLSSFFSGANLKTICWPALFLPPWFYCLKGFKILNLSRISCLCCISSEYNKEQLFSKADAITKLS